MLGVAALVPLSICCFTEWSSESDSVQVLGSYFCFPRLIAYRLRFLGASSSCKSWSKDKRVAWVNICKVTCCADRHISMDIKIIQWKPLRHRMIKWKSPNQCHLTFLLKKKTKHEFWRTCIISNYCSHFGSYRSSPLVSPIYWGENDICRLLRYFFSVMSVIINSCRITASVSRKLFEKKL